MLFGAKTPREIIAESECVLGHGLKGRGRRQSADCILFDLDAAGFIIVPKEPTKEMILAGETAVENNCDETSDSYSSYTIVNDAGAAHDAYVAMITEWGAA
jgi:hypothetical protein